MSFPQQFFVSAELSPLATGLALGGGGSKRSFQLGAIKYLYERRGVIPEVPSCTSVGAVNKIKLVESGQEALIELERIWHNLRGNSDMYEQESWLRELSTELRDAFSIEKIFLTFAGFVFLPFLPIKILLAFLPLGTLADLREDIHDALK
jgi:predicted acylesterase/phospholipase RssA